MSEPQIVRGSECLNYVNRPIGFGNIRGRMDNNTITESGRLRNTVFDLYTHSEPDATSLWSETFTFSPTLWKCPHDTSKRIGALLLDNFSDGGKKVAIFGNETITPNSIIITKIQGKGGQQYELKFDGSGVVARDYQYYVQYGQGQPTGSGFAGLVIDEVRAENYSFDDILDFMPTFRSVDFRDFWDTQGLCFKQGGNPITGNTSVLTLTRNRNTTVTYGENEIESILTRLYGVCNSRNPLEVFTGDFYHFLNVMSQAFKGQCPDSFISYAYLEQWTVSSGQPANSMNCICIPYNIPIFNDKQLLDAYLDTGELSDGAYLYPLDFDNLPSYKPADDDDEPGQDDNKPDDNIRDVTPNPPVVPSFTPQMLTNNNYYWLTAPELQAFISWYWNDVGNIQDIDDLLAKIEGLYNNLSQAILNIRYMPVDVSWIGGTGQQSNIKIAQIEKNGAVDTLSKLGKPSVESIGNIHIPNKYKSFVDMSPYSQLSIYLPYHGFLDLDINIFSGHDLYVKAIYDYMSGTIQYLIYYDNQFLVNTIVCKMAMDIPISLQTKNDRDSAVFQNVSNVVGGLMGAGLSIGTGNPMGLLVGANALNSGVASAPLNVKGNVGEQGAFYAPPQCAIILRRPTISKPSQDIWKSKVGQICGKSYTLSNLSGYTTVYNPQITFNGNKNADGVTIRPLQSEVEEIYSALEKGVII